MGAAPASVGEALAWGSACLARAGLEASSREAALLLGEALGWSAERVFVGREEGMAPAALFSYWRLLRRRARREPLAYILGRREFMSLDFLVDRRVFIPRPETEILVEEALGLLRGTSSPRVAEVGTGSGAIAVSLAYYLPACLVVASDVSPEALEVARQNALRHGVVERVRLVAGEGLAPLAPWGPFRAILSNPPYVGEGEKVDPEVRWEPRVAWWAGPDPLAFFRLLVEEGVPLLEPGGFLAAEVGRGQARRVADMWTGPLHEVKVRPDLAGAPRVVVGWRK